MNHPFIKVASPQIDDADVDSVVRALRSGRLTSGPLTAEFERDFAAYVGTKHAVAVNSGTAALHAALAASGIEPGDEVIVPALTFFSTVTAVIHQHGVPVFADISPDTFSLDPDDLERALTPRTKAVLPVHYFGNAAEMDPILEFAAAHGLKVIEDCAQSHGTTYKGKVTGSIGDFGAYSFFATKHMTTAEGGMVTTDSDEAADFMRHFRSHGLEGRHDHTMLGYNYRLPEPNAALGITQLKKLDRLNAQRIEVCEKLIEKIRDVPWLTVPKVAQHVKHTYFWCHIAVDEEKLGMNTQALIAKLAELGVEVRNRYVEPLYRQPLLNDRLPSILKLVAGDNLPDYGSLNLPNVERLAGCVIGLPNRPDLADWEIDRVSEVLHSLG